MLRCELRNQRDTSNAVILVPLLNPKFATILTARRVRTSGSEHCAAAQFHALSLLLCGPYLTLSAPALQATASWSPVAPLQPMAPMILPPSTSGKPPGEATRVGSSVEAKAPAGVCMTLKKTCDGRR